MKDKDEKNKKSIHYGQAIKTKVKERGMPVAEFARRINQSRNNMYNIFKRKDVNTRLLKTISKVLDYDFIHDL